MIIIGIIAVIAVIFIIAQEKDGEILPPGSTNNPDNEWDEGGLKE